VAELDLNADEWEALVASARREGVAGLVYQALKETGAAEGLGDEAKRELEDAQNTSLFRNLVFYQELKRMAAALPDEVPFLVVLKGAALAATLYSSIALRPLRDVDVLARAKDLEAARRAAEAIGYQEDWKAWTAPHVNRIAGHHASLVKEGLDLMAMELHWDLGSAYTRRARPPLEWFFSHLMEFEPRAGVPRSPKLRVFDPTAQFVHSAFHLLLQNTREERRLIWSFDLHLLVTEWGARLDWEEIVAQARAWHWTGLLSGLLDDLARDFQTRVPDGVRNALEVAPSWESGGEVLALAHEDPSRSARMWTVFSNLGVRGRVEFLYAMIFPSPRYMRWRYKPARDWMWALYYPYRWFDVARDTVLTWARRTATRDAGHA
jgi:hypothetical protein